MIVYYQADHLPWELSVQQRGVSELAKKNVDFKPVMSMNIKKTYHQLFPVTT